MLSSKPSIALKIIDICCRKFEFKLFPCIVLVIAILGEVGSVNVFVVVI